MSDPKPEKPHPDAFGLKPTEARFVYLLIEGLSQSAAYAEAFGKDPDPEKTGKFPKAIVEAASRLANRDAVVRYRRALMAYDRDSMLTVGEKRRFLADVVRTPVGKLTADSPLVHKITDKEIVGYDAIKAMQEDSKLAGHYPKEQNEDEDRKSVIGMSSRLIDMLLAKATATD